MLKITTLSNIIMLLMMLMSVSRAAMNSTLMAEHESINPRRLDLKHPTLKQLATDIQAINASNDQLMAKAHQAPELIFQDLLSQIDDSPSSIWPAQAQEYIIFNHSVFEDENEFDARNTLDDDDIPVPSLMEVEDSDQLEAVDHSPYEDKRITTGQELNARRPQEQLLKKKLRAKQLIVSRIMILRWVFHLLTYRNWSI